ncbi:MAG: glycosyltransferase family 39 protein [Chloroflexi bacterium]|nr:glycosyltransferase family 39 protein [Chloroflexota bacterium]MCL5273419.1 glycosyltransferase family 39 protein [Chloroflexota bacterium]
MAAIRRNIWPIGLGVLLFAVAFVYFLPGINQAVNIYDEGIIVYSAVRVMEGQLPYRDFWSIYSPGQFYALAAAFKLFGVTIQTERLLDTTLRAFVPLFAFLVAARLTNRRTALVAWAGTTAWMAFYVYSYQYQWVFYGYPAYPAIALCLAAIWLMTIYFTEQRVRWLAASGVMLGIAALFRHDFGIYCGVGQVAALGLYSLLQPAPGADGATRTARLVALIKRFVRVLLPYALGAAVIFLPVALVFVALTPFNELVYDLFTFPAVIFPRFRALPYPPLELLNNLPFYLPFAVVLMAGAAAFVAARRRTAEGIAYASCVAMLIVFGALAFNQARVRSDIIHTPAFFIPSVILLVILLRGIPQPVGKQTDASQVLSALAVLALVLVFAEPLVDRAGLLTDAKRMNPPTAAELPRASTAVVNRDMVQAVLYIQSHTQPQDRIFVGNTFHNKIFVNEPMFYFLAARDAGTRYHELHPGVATTVPVQQEIAGDLEKYHVQYLVLSSRFERANEPNESSVDSGVTVLDDYIHSHFLPMMQIGPYAIWRRV